MGIGELILRMIQKGRFDLKPDGVRILVNADGSLHGIYISVPLEELEQINKVVTTNTMPERGVRLMCWHPDWVAFQVTTEEVCKSV